MFKIKNDFVFKCHNCGMGRTLANFLKDQDSFLHDQYVMEKFKDGRTGKGTTVPNPKFNFSEPKFVKKDTGLEKISDLNISHPAPVRSARLLRHGSINFNSPQRVALWACDWLPYMVQSVASGRRSSGVETPSGNGLECL